MEVCDSSAGNTVSLKTLKPAISVLLPGVAGPLAEYALRRAAERLLVASQAITYMRFADAQKGVTGYPVPAGTCFLPLNVTLIKYNSKCYQPHADNCDTTRTVPGFVQVSSTWIELDEAPTADCDNAIVMNITGMINPGTCDIPADIYYQYQDAIVTGALSFLYGMREEDWYSPIRVTEFSDKFDKTIEKATAAAQLSKMPSDGIAIGGGGLIL